MLFDFGPLAWGVLVGAACLFGHWFGPIAQLPAADDRTLLMVATWSVICGAIVQGCVWAYKQTTGAIRDAKLADAEAFEDTWLGKHKTEVEAHELTKAQLEAKTLELESVRAAYALLKEKMSAQSWPAIPKNSGNEAS